MRGITTALVAITVLPLLAILGIVTGTAIVGAHAAASCSSDQSAALGGTAAQPGASSTATNGIPANYLALYKKAGQAYGIPWNMLAGIGRVETNHGADKRTSSAGAQGPMQFMPGTWAGYGVDGNGDGQKDIRDPADAIPGAAKYLKANGAPGNIRKALWAYNHDYSYGTLVLNWAKRYAAGNFQVTPDTGGSAGGPPDLTDCPSTLSPYNNVAAGTGPIARAQKYLGWPYTYGGGGPNGPGHGFCDGVGGWTNGVCMATKTVGFDCSSLVEYAWWPWHHLPRTADIQYTSGGTKIPIAQAGTGDLIFWANPGSLPHHVAMVVDPTKHLAINAPQTGSPIRYRTYHPGEAQLQPYAVRPGKVA